ncbi:hypothetical protein BpHYR1_046109 [Brachionus plicatilis]|uniref:Uncharacterized protein n=1 Tax=Brachionus plicatilis TaxID=10195 RepID=A0A3M7QMH2_BRAPC|nr:hypothetical protein BpHYR1_046109 [Brachionus plicatilis]
MIYLDSFLNFESIFVLIVLCVLKSKIKKASLIIKIVENIYVRTFVASFAKNKHDQLHNCFMYNEISLIV